MSQPRDRTLHTADRDNNNIKRKFNLSLSPLKKEKKNDFKRIINYGMGPGNLINELNIFDEVHNNKRNNYYNTTESKFRIKKQVKVASIIYDHKMHYLKYQLVTKKKCATTSSQTDNSTTFNESQLIDLKEQKNTPNDQELLTKLKEEILDNDPFQNIDAQNPNNKIGGENKEEEGNNKDVIVRLEDLNFDDIKISQVSLPKNITRKKVPFLKKYHC